MRTTIVFCLFLNLVVILASGALLIWYPSRQGFTLTTSHTTNYFSGGIIPSAVLLCLFDIAVGIYLGWAILHPR